MKKNVLLVVLGIALSAGAMAQTKDIKKDQKVLKNTVKDKKEDRKEMGKDVTHLRVKAAVNHRKEVRRHKRSIHRQGEHLEAHGVKHPVRKAQHQAHLDKENKQ